MKEIKTEFAATLYYGIEINTSLNGLIIESRGGAEGSIYYKNPEHSLLLAYVLNKLKNAKVSDLEIYVASKNLNYKNIDERKIFYNGNSKIDLTRITDFDAFLKDVKMSIKQSGQNESSEGGNDTKKLLLYSNDFDLEKLFMQPIEEMIEKVSEEEVEYTLQKIKKRLRQSKFRKELLAAYNNTCAVTGSKVIELLEAAHIQPYNGVHTSVVRNGILLRSDIHDLFDIYIEGKRLINISANYKIEVHSSLKDSEYWQYNEKEIRLPNEKIDYPEF